MKIFTDKNAFDLVMVENGLKRTVFGTGETKVLDSYTAFHYFGIDLLECVGAQLI